MLLTFKFLILIEQYISKSTLIKALLVQYLNVINNLCSKIEQYNMIGNEIHNFARELWPLNRSLTGEGVRETLKKIKEHLPNLKIHSIPSGTQVFDWTIPKEWKVNSAYIISPSGKRICDFSKNNLHLVGYSVPHAGSLDLADLKKKLYTLPEQPDAIPYVTSYYEKEWGFCISYNDFKSLEKGEYKIKIDTELFDGELNYGELIIPGNSEIEVFEYIHLSSLNGK